MELLPIDAKAVVAAISQRDSAQLEKLIEATGASSPAMDPIQPQKRPDVEWAMIAYQMLLMDLPTRTAKTEKILVDLFQEIADERGKNGNH